MLSFLNAPRFRMNINFIGRLLGFVCLSFVQSNLDKEDEYVAMVE